MIRYGNFLGNGKETSTSCTTVPLDINMYRKKRKETEKKRRTNGGNGNLKKRWRTKRQRNRQETEKKHYGNGKETFQKKRNRNAQNVSSNTKDMYDPFNKMSPVPVGCALRRGRQTCIHIYIYVYNGRTAVLPSYHAIKFNPMLYHTI